MRPVSDIVAAQTGNRGLASLRSLIETSPRQLQLVETVSTIREKQPAPGELTFLASRFVQVTLPHSDPGDVSAWRRSNGNIVLVITRTKLDLRTGNLVGYPYGSIPRLLLYWLTSEALRTKSPNLRLGASLNEFMHAVGLSLFTGGGKRSNATRLKDQMNRLFSASIGFQDARNPALDHSGGMRVTRESCLWQNKTESREEGSRGYGWLELSQDFYQTIIHSPVPVDIRALRGLNHSPLALDLYAWATFKAYSTSLRNKSEFVPYKDLQQQLGSQYSELKAFGRKFRTALRLVQTVYPEFAVQVQTGGIEIKPSQTAIAQRA